MHPSSICRMAALLIIFGAAPLLTPAQDASQPSGDPVADAARKARAEQKKEPKAKKVFTNDDIPSAPAAAPAPSAPATGQAGGAQAPEKITGKKVAAGDENKKGEEYWRKRFGEVHQKISETQQELDVLQKELNKDQVQYYGDPQKALLQQHDRSDINDRTAKVDAKKKELEALNQKLSDLEDELRKSGGDPGWAR